MLERPIWLSITPLGVPVEPDVYIMYIKSSADERLFSSKNEHFAIKKEVGYNNDIQEIELPVKGYPALMNAYYNTIDLGLYLTSGLMPIV